MGKLKIKVLSLKDFMIFENLRTEFSCGINILSGINSTGKTAILKVLYSFARALTDSQKVHNNPYDKIERIFRDKFVGVFRPDNGNLGRLINNKSVNKKATIKIYYENGNHFEMFLENDKTGKIELAFDTNTSTFLFSNSIYIPPKEIISSAENFGSLYRDYEIGFEETYADLCYLLEKPLKRETIHTKYLIERLLNMLGGDIKRNDGKFYLNTNNEETYEMGLLSEGYKKLATLLYLIQSGSLSKNSILFWDEPEGNMNPKMLLPLAEILSELSKIGTQIFIATHSYFVQQAFDFQKRKDKEIQVNFFSLFQDDVTNTINIEKTDFINELEHNSVMEEFNAVYYREQELFYRD